MPKVPTVLIINDKTLSKDLQSNLSDDDFKVLIAKGDSEAIKTLSLKKPDIIVIDADSKKFITDMLSAIKSNKKLEEIPVITISKNANVDDKIEWLNAGVIDCVSKPYEYRELAARMNSKLRLYFSYLDIMAQNEVLREIAVVDEVTGLFNRRYLMGRITGEVSRSVRQGDPLSFLIIDIDEVEALVNDFGEDAKNFILKQIAFMIKEAVRLSDIVIRYGETKLAVLCPITDKSGLEVFAERLRQKIERTQFDFNGTNLRTTVSMGAYTLGTSDFNSLEKKIQNIFAFTEEALSRAKGFEGNKLEFFE